jgi:hypothetical protein
MIIAVVSVSAGCSTGQKILDDAIVKTDSVSSMKARVSASVTLDGMSIGELDGVILYSGDDLLFKSNIKSEDETLAVEWYANLNDFEDVDSALTIPDYPWTKIGKGYELELKSEQIVELVKMFIAPELDEADDSNVNSSIKLTATVKSGYLNEVTFAISDETDGAQTSITGTVKYYDFNVPVDTTPSDDAIDIRAVWDMLRGADDVDTNPIQIFLDEEKLTFAADSTPFEMNDRVFVPARVLVEKMGGSIAYVYDGFNETVTASLNGSEIILTIGSNFAYVNGEVVWLDVPPTVVNGRTFLPLRFVSENFGATVDYDYFTDAGNEVLFVYINTQ